MTTELTHEQPAASGLFNASTPRKRLVLAEQFVRMLPPVQIEIRHHFADGVYAREGYVPKGTWFVGRIHHKAQINIISKGSILVLTESGPILMEAPCTLVSPPGAQRAAYAVEDTVWTTILATSESDPDVIFDTYTSPTYEDFQAAQGEILKIMEG